MCLRKFYILLLCLPSNMAIAQYEGEDVEKILHDPYGTGAAAKAQRESAWSLSGSPSEWSIPVKTGGWHTEKINPKFMPIGGSFANNTFARKISRKSTQSTTGTHVRTNPKFMQWKRAQIQRAQEEARRREEAKKIERERNRAIQAVQYNATMSNYRIQHLNRIAEKIESLKQVNAIDYVNVPQGVAGPKPNTLSNQEMADLLKPKPKEEEGSITVEFVEENTKRENHRNVSIGEDKKIDLFDDGGYNQNELELWKQSLLSKSPVVQQENTQEKKCVAQNYIATLLIEKGWLDIDSLNITTLPNMGCVALMGDSILLLDNDSMSFIKWGVDANAYQIITCGKRTIGKLDNQIIEIKDRELELICELDDKEFDIYHETDSTIVVKANVADLNIVARININTKTYDEILRTPTIIRKVVSNGKIMLSLLKKRIIDISEVPKLFYLSETPINDICMCKEGLLVATENKVFLLESPQNTYILTDEGASKVWCDGTDIYLINNKGNLIRYAKKQEL